MSFLLLAYHFKFKSWPRHYKSDWIDSSDFTALAWVCFILVFIDKKNLASETILLIKCQMYSELYFSLHWNHSGKFLDFFFLHRFTLALFLHKTIYQYVWHLFNTLFNLYLEFIFNWKTLIDARLIQYQQNRLVIC